MQIYVNKNGQQSGPFEEAQILEMLKSGQLAPSDLGFKQGQERWQSLGAMFPNLGQVPGAAISAARSATTLPVNKPGMNKRTVGGIYVFSVCLMFFGLVVGGMISLAASESGHPNLLITGAGAAIFGYLQFLLVHVIIMFYVLFKMWDSIQDGVSTSTGKAIGFLFIPIFSIFWIFKVWGGFPTEYNNFIDRYQLNVPRLVSSVYMLVPIFALLSGLLLIPVIAVPFIFIALISQTADAVNVLSKGLENKRAGSASVAEIEKVSLLSPFAKVLAFGLAGISVTALIGSIGFSWWNLNPKPGPDDLPETVGGFSKTQILMNRGSYTGSRKQFGALYETADKKKAIVYDVRNATFESEKTLSSYSYSRKGEVTDSNGNKAGEYGFSGGSLEIYNGSKKLLIWDLNRATPTYVLPSEMKREGKINSLNESEMLEFAKSLPVNSKLRFSEFNSPGTAPTNTTTDKTGPDPDRKVDPEISAADNADFTMTSDEFWELTRKSEANQYEGRIFDVSGRIYSVGDSPGLKANIHDTLDINFSSTQSFSDLKDDERVKLRCAGIKKYGRLELTTCLILENKGIISADDAPDFTMTSDEYKKNTQNVLNKYRNKVIDITGKVKLIGNKGQYLATSDSWLPCYPLAGKESDFQSLADGAEVKFRGLGDVGGLRHCIVISR